MNYATWNPVSSSGRINKDVNVAANAVDVINKDDRFTTLDFATVRLIHLVELI